MPSARAKRSAAQAELPAVAGTTTTTTTTAAAAEDVGGGGGSAGVDDNNNNGGGGGSDGGQRRSARSNVATTGGGGGGNTNTAAGKGGATTTTTKEDNNNNNKEQQPAKIIHYRIGEILTKYFADSNNRESDVFEVRIPAECTVSTNRQVRGHQLWGTDVYTSDSDVVAVLMHCGFYVPSLQVPPSLYEIRARVRRVDDVSDEFRSSSRNGIRSRAWGKSGFAKKKTIGGEKLVAAPAPAAVGAAAGTPADAKEGETKEGGEGENAEGGEGGVAASAAHPLSNGVLQTSNGQIINADDFGMVVESAVAVTVNQQIIELMPTAPESLRYMVVPTFVPEDKERAQRTRAASNANVNVARKKRMIREVTVLYNLCNEPWMKYSMAAVADKGFKKSQWTSARLRRDTLYLETKDERYQLSWVKGKGKDENEGSYQFAKCKRALPLEEMRKKGIPLPKDELKDEIKNLSWNEVKFGVRGLKVKESEYPVTRLQFLAQTSSA
jgi:hypothetical protein